MPPFLRNRYRGADNLPAFAESHSPWRIKPWSFTITANPLSPVLACCYRTIGKIKNAGGDKTSHIPLKKVFFIVQ